MTQEAPFIQFSDKDKVILTINRDGNVELGEGIELTEASKRFYDYVSDFIRNNSIKDEFNMR